jgi:NAD(P)-dependent dehydrogenase (short-subunit alcohol dehydrogenase family)
MSLAVILGSSRGLGLALARAHLATSALDVVCASRTPDAAREAILQGMDDGAARRLTTLAVDVTDERSIEEAAKQCREMGELRSLWNVAGVVSAAHGAWLGDAAHGAWGCRMRAMQCRAHGCAEDVAPAPSAPQMSRLNPLLPPPQLTVEKALQHVEYEEMLRQFK